MVMRVVFRPDVVVRGPTVMRAELTNVCLRMWPSVTCRLWIIHPTSALVQGVGTTAVDARCTLKADSLTPSRPSHHVVRTMSAVRCAAVKTNDLQWLRLPGCDDVR